MSTKYCVIFVLFLTFAFSASLMMVWHKHALDTAEHQASIRLLSSFHKDYLRSKKLSEQEYLDELKKYNKNHSGLLDEYVNQIDKEE